MKRTLKNYFLLCALAGSILPFCFLSGCGQKDTELSSGGQPSPEAEADSAAGIVFEGKDLNGNSLSSEIFSGSKLTMVNVWATYCNPCLSEMPALGELASEYESEELQIIGVISDVLEGADALSKKTAEDLIQETGAFYPHLLLNASLYHGLLADVSAVPTTFFIDQEGTVVDTVIGALDKYAWEEKINELLETLS